MNNGELFCYEAAGLSLEAELEEAILGLIRAISRVTDNDRCNQVKDVWIINQNGASDE